MLYQHPTYTRKFYECPTAIEVYGIRFEPVAECEMTTEYEGYPCSDYRCSACGKVHSAPRAHERCPRCGAKVTRGRRQAHTRPEVCRNGYMFGNGLNVPSADVQEALRAFRMEAMEW